MFHEEVMKLIEAGFNADEIRLMMNGNTEEHSEPAKDTEPVKDPDPEPVKEPVKEPEPVKDPEPDQFAEYMRSIEALRQEVENLRSTFSAAAVRMDNINQPAPETVSDVLASIINPKTKKEV